MEETIFDYLSEEDRFEGNELFEELVVNWDLLSMTLEEAFKIGFARGRNVVVTIEEPNSKVSGAGTASAGLPDYAGDNKGELK